MPTTHVTVVNNIEYYAITVNVGIVRFKLFRFQLRNLKAQYPNYNFAIGVFQLDAE